MAAPRWKKFEDQVRGVAGLVWRKACHAGRHNGVDFDGIIKISDQEIVLIEISVRSELQKIREDIAKLNVTRLSEASNGVVVRGFIVLDGDPTPSMISTAAESRVTVLSINSLAATFFEFERYSEARLAAAFGSSIDPFTGEVDKTTYVPVSYTDESTGRDLTLEHIGDHLLSGRNIILLGEYGSGKSRCLRQIFALLASDWGVNFRFPFAINLRECWGLTSGVEIVRRHLRNLGLDELESPAVRVLNSGSALLLFDGFDEIGSQSWSTDENRLRQLRSQALSGVRDAVAASGAGCVIAGREHYFSSNDEMFRALGLKPENTIIIRAKNEFSEDETAQYFSENEIQVTLPTWLPRRPLICQTIASLSEEEFEQMFGAVGNDVNFWNRFIKVICERDARINTYFDAETIYRVFISLARQTRNLQANVGPISQRALQEAFEAAVGKLPVEDASVMLLRLPSLGRVGLESSDRQFVDMFILDGLRAKDITRALEPGGPGPQEIIIEQWTNPLEPLGQNVLALDMRNREESFVQLAASGASSKNATLVADIVASAARISEHAFSFKGLELHGGSFAQLDFSKSRVQDIHMTECLFDHIVLPSSPPLNVSIDNSMAAKVSGASSFTGLPAWITKLDVDKFDSVQNVAEIRRAGLSPSQEVLVSILKKTFLQKGAGRKEDALFRGFGAGSIKGLATKIISILMAEGFLSKHKGKEGWIYSPERSMTARVRQMVEQLRSSEDEVWKQISALDEN